MEIANLKYGDEMKIAVPFEDVREVIYYGKTVDGRFGFIERMDGERSNQVREWDFHLREIESKDDKICLKPFAHSRIFREKTKGYEARIMLLNPGVIA